MSVTSAAWSFALVAGLVTLTPGLDTALVLRAALTRGRRHAAATSLGICTGVLVWALAAAVGVSALLSASKAGYTTLRIAGALYMVVLGGRLIFHAVKGGAHRVVTNGPTLDRNVWVSFRIGLFSNLLNPKVGAFYVAMLPQFIPAGASALLVGTLLGVIHIVEGLAWFTVLILTASSMRTWLARPNAQRAIDGLTGSVLIGFGAKLAGSSRH